MANNIATFVVDIVTKGLKSAKDATAQVGKNASQAAASYTGAEKAAGGFYNTQAKGVIGTANSTKSFSKLAETMNNSSGVVGAYATLAANVFAVTAAFNALRSAAQVQQITAGLEAMGNRMGTTLSVAASNLQKISGMTLTYEQSLRSTAQIASSGFGTKDIERLGKVANDVSVALGRNMTDSMDRLTRGVVKLEPELLDELGLMTKIGESTSRYANTLGKSVGQLSNFEKRQGFLNAIVAEGQAKFGGLADTAGNTRNLDLLAATFANLTKDIFNLMNSAALPLAAIFSNKGVLLGGMLLFASSISKQLLPGLTNMQIKVAQNAIALKDLAKAQITAVPTSRTEPKAVKSLRNAINNDKADAGTYTKALDSISVAEKKLDAEITQGYSKRKQFSKMNVAQLIEERGILQDQEVGIRKTMVLEAQAAAKTKGANAISAAGQKKVMISWYLTKDSVRSYKSSLDQATAAGTRFAVIAPVLNTVRAGFFAAAIGARVLGAALVSALGFIGLLVAGVMLLIDGFKWLKEWWQGPAVKKFNEAIEEQETIIGQLGDRYDEMNRMKNSSVSVSVKEQAVYKVLTNTIRENIEAYEKVKAAQDAAFADKSTVKVGDTREFETLKKLRNFGGPEVKRQIDDALGKNGLTGILENAGKEIDKDKLGKLSKILTEDLRTGAVTLGDHINDLAEAFKNAETSIADFNRSAVPNTPYDTVVQNLDGVSSALTNISLNAASSDDYISRLAHTVTAAGPNFKNFFSTDLQKTLKDFNALDEKMSKAGYETNKADTERRRKLSEILALRSTELYDVQELFLNAQRLSRQTQVQIGLEQSRLDKLNSYTALTGSSIKQRREAENKILQLQANQIKAQLEIVKRQIEITKQEMEHNLVLLKKDEIYQGIIASINGVGAATNTNFINEVNNRIMDLQAERDRGNGRSVAVINAEIASLVEVVGKRKEINDQMAAIRDKQDQIAAGEGQITAILEQQTSALIINAEAMATNAQTLAANSQKEVDTTQQRIKNARILSDITLKQQGRVRGTADEYNLMVNEQNLLSTIQKTQIANAAKAEIMEMRLQQARAAGNSEEVAAYATRIGQTESLANAKMVEIDRQNQLNILDKFSFNIHKEGLEMQKDSLDYMQKGIDAQQEYINLQREGRNLTAEIARKRAGLGSNEFTNRSEAIDEAKSALKFAVENASIRKSVIKLEYALLDAQRQMAIWNLTAQQKILGANSEQGKQLAVVITNLENSADTIGQAQEAATRSIDQNINNLSKKLISLGLGDPQGGFVGSKLSSYIKSRQDEAMARRVGQNQLNQSKTEAIPAYIPPLVQSNTNLTTSVINGTAATIALTAEMRKASTVAIPAVTVASGKLLDYAKQAEAAGVRVYEMAGRGGVNPGAHRGRGHVSGRAFDASIAGGMGDQRPENRAKMDALAKKFVDQGLIVLWNGQRLSQQGNRALTTSEGAHKDHMHVEIPAGQARVIGAAVGQAITPPLQQAMQEPLAATTDTAEKQGEAAEAIKAAANDNDKPIVVTGQRKPASMPKDFESLAGYFQMATSDGEGSMLAVFEEMADKLGPQGTIVPQIIAGINELGSAIIQFQKIMESDTATFGDKFAAGAAIAQSAIGTIQGVLQAASDARIAGIDREIAAEQKKDGKSAESVAKIKALEAKKDGIARKSFNTNKKLMMAQAIIATAAGMAQALTLGPIVGPIMMAVIGALGAAQLAIIAGTSYQSTSAANFDQKTMPSTLTIGKRGDSVDLAKHNTNVGGELGYLRGSQGTGNNSSNYSLGPGSAYGGPLPRGYGHSAFMVGEKGPEIISPNNPVSVRPINDNENGRPLSVAFHVQAFDGQSVETMLFDRRGDIIDMLRGAANESGDRFLENVNTSNFKKANGRSGGRRI